MAFINSTETIGIILNAGTSNLTGSMEATLFMILAFIIIIAIMFQIPLEIIFLLVLPFCLAVGAYYGSFMIPIIVILIFLSALITKNWLFK